MRRGLFPALLAGCWLLAPAGRSAADDRPRRPGDDFFEKKVRPILADNCAECHGPRKQRGGLRLDSRASVMAGGDSGPALVPGKPNESLLIKAVHYDGDTRMPPRGRLTAAQVAVLTDWVKQGAPWPDPE